MCVYIADAYWIFIYLITVCLIHYRQSPKSCNFPAHILFDVWILKNITSWSVGATLNRAMTTA